MAKITITARRCQRCIKVHPAPPPGGLCAGCSKNWKVDTKTGRVVKK